jgi:hypothetical protein
MEIQYSQLKINHLNDTPSTKADRGGISVVCLTRTSRYRSKRRSWLVPLLPTSSNKGEKGKKCPGTIFLARVPKKVRFEKHCDLCKNYGGAHTMHNTRDCCRYEKDGKEKSKFCAAKKGGYKGNPVNQNFMQLTKKIEKLEKALKKSGKKGQKRRYKDSDSDSE